MTILPDYAALYPRVSTGRQKDNWSVKDQLALARLGTERGLRVVLYDRDLGISGETIEGRPDMTLLLQDLQGHRISKPADVDGNPTAGGRLVAVICVDLNRLSRAQDSVDGSLIKRTCKQAGAVILTPGKTYDFAEESDQLLAGIELLVAGNQKQKIVKAVSRGLYKKAHDGEWPGGVVPYGYQVVDKRLAPHPERAEVVRLLYRLYTEGYTDEGGQWHPLTLGGVATRLNAAGHRLPGRARKEGPPPTPRPFEAADVDRILSSRLYAGYKSWGGGPKAKKNANPYVRDFGPAEVLDPAVRIVEPGVWLAAAQQRQARATGPRRLAAVERPLLGLLRCPRCEGHLHAHIVRQTEAGSMGERRPVLVYSCLNFRRNGTVAGRGCPDGGFHVSDRVARDAVNDYLFDAFTGVDLDAQLAEVERQAEAATRGGLRKELQTGLDEVRLEVDRLVQAAKAGALSLDDIRTERQALDAKQARLEARLAGLDAGDGALRERLRLVQQLRGPNGQQTVEQTVGHMTRMGHRQPALYRQFLGWFFVRLVVDGAGHGRGRRVWVDRTRVTYTEAGGRFLAPRSDAPLMRNSQEWETQAGWLTPLGLLLPTPGQSSPGASAGGAWASAARSAARSRGGRSCP